MSTGLENNMSEVNLAWNEYSDVELANNELVSLFTMNRCLRRLLDNDRAFGDYVSQTVSGIQFADDSDMVYDASEDGKATTPVNIAHYLHGDSPGVSNGMIKHDVMLTDSSIYKAPSIPSVKMYIDNAAQHATESISGVAEIATIAEVSAGTDDTKIVTPLKLMDMFSNSKTANGYQKLPNGLILKWGTGTTTHSPYQGTPQIITYSPAFDNACIYANAVGDCGYSSGSEIVSVDIGDTSKTQLAINANGVFPFWWFAIGY